MNHDHFGVLDRTPEPPDIWEQGSFDEFEPRRVSLEVEYCAGQIAVDIRYRGEYIDRVTEKGTPESLTEWVEMLRDALRSAEIRLERTEF